VIECLKQHDLTFALPESGFHSKFGVAMGASGVYEATVHSIAGQSNALITATIPPSASARAINKKVSPLK
jgi:hypothetical protein